MHLVDPSNRLRINRSTFHVSPFAHLQSFLQGVHHTCPQWLGNSYQHLGLSLMSLPPHVTSSPPSYPKLSQANSLTIHRTFSPLHLPHL